MSFKAKILAATAAATFALPAFAGSEISIQVLSAAVSIGGPGSLL